MGCTSSRETTGSVIQRGNNSSRDGRDRTNGPSRRFDDETSTNILPARTSAEEERMQRMMQRDPLFFAADIYRNGSSISSRRRRLRRFMRDEERRAERRYPPDADFLDLDRLDISDLIGGRSENMRRIEFGSEAGWRRENAMPGSFDFDVDARENDLRFGPRRDDENLDRLRSDLETFELLFQTLLRHSNDHHGDPPVQGCPPASKSAIERLPTMKISERDFEDEPKKECCICFLDFEVNKEVCRLPCGHIFHTDCVAQWLRKKNTCPECRWELETDDQRYEVERKERMKSRKSRIKDHELDRLCIEALQDMAGNRELTSRAKLIETIKGLDSVDVIVAPETSK